jgi:hypothetical protein
MFLAVRQELLDDLSQLAFFCRRGCGCHHFVKTAMGFLFFCAKVMLFSVDFDIPSLARLPEPGFVWSSHDFLP